MSSINETNTRKTNVQELTFGNRGIDLPEEKQILDWVIQDFQNAFGQNLKFYNSKGEFYFLHLKGN